MELEKLINKLDAEVKTALEQSAFACFERRGVEITIEDLLLRLLDTSTELTTLLQQFEINTDSFRAAVLLEQDTRQTLSAKPVFSESLIDLLQSAWLISSLAFDGNRVTCAALVLSLLQNKLKFGQRGYVALLHRVDEVQLNAFTRSRPQCFGTLGAVNESDSQQPARSITNNAAGAGILGQVSSSITALAKAQKLDPVIGRDDEVRQMIDTLCRRRKNNPILLGEAGVGKTAIVEGLAQKIASEAVPPELRDVDIRLLDLAALQAGASVKGEFERRVSELIAAIQASATPVILFIDEAHLIVGAGANEGGNDIANLLKPALARGELRTIAATTWVEYKRYIERDPALVRRFQPVKVGEPTIAQTVTLLRGVRDRYETEHGVYIRDDALLAAAELSARYLVGRQLPDKAIDLIDTACARVRSGLSGKPVSVEKLEMEIEEAYRHKKAMKRDQLNDGVVKQNESDICASEKTIDDLKLQLASVESVWHLEQRLVEQIMGLRNKDVVDKVNTSQHKLVQQDELKALRAELVELQGESPLLHYEVSAQQVSQVLSSWTGIPAGKMLMDEAQKMGALSTQLGQRVKGQHHAVQSIGERLCQARVGLNDPDKPLGVFLLVGPSGVGKTETALTVADTLFGGEKYLTTINMSEFQEKHTTSRLIGSPPGYVGYGEGGVLTEAVRQKPFSVVLLDEVEKADPDVLNVFYQVFDKGTMNDGQGRLIDFRNTVIVLTSNLAADQIEMQCASEGRSAGDMGGADDMGVGRLAVSDEMLMEEVRPTLNQFFKPALLARMDVLIYRPLQQQTLEALVESKLTKLGERLATQGVALTVDPSVWVAISRKCVVVEAGARHIDKVINQHIVPKLSRLLLSSIERQSELSKVYLKWDSHCFEVLDITSDYDGYEVGAKRASTERNDMLTEA